MIKWTRTSRLSIKISLSCDLIFGGVSRPLSSKYGTHKTVVDYQGKESDTAASAMRQLAIIFTTQGFIATEITTQVD